MLNFSRFPPQNLSLFFIPLYSNILALPAVAAVSLGIYKYRPICILRLKSELLCVNVALLELLISFFHIRPVMETTMSKKGARVAFFPMAFHVC